MGLQVVSFKQFEKGTLRGFATIRMTNIGLEIRDCAVHEKNGSRWFQLPSKQVVKPDRSQWGCILDFYDKSRKEQFQAAAMAALDAFLAKGRNGNGF